jgi:hypothetical protein
MATAGIFFEAANKAEYLLSIVKQRIGCGYVNAQSIVSILFFSESFLETVAVCFLKLLTNGIRSF